MRFEPRARCNCVLVGPRQRITGARREGVLVFEIPDREHGSGVDHRHARALGVAREGMTVTGTRSQRVEKVVV